MDTRARAIGTAIIALASLATVLTTTAAAADPCTLSPRAGDFARPYIASITAAHDGVRVRLTRAGVTLARSYESAGAIASWTARLFGWTPRSCRSFADLWWNVGRMSSEIWLHAKGGDSDISIRTGANWQNPIWQVDQARRDWWRVIPR